MCNDLCEVAEKRMRPSEMEAGGSSTSQRSWSADTEGPDGGVGRGGVSEGKWELSCLSGSYR